MKGTLILAILFVAIHSLSLISKHQAHIFAHQGTLITQPTRASITNSPASPTTTQSNSQISTQTQTSKTLLPAQSASKSAPPVNPSKFSPKPDSTVNKPASSNQIQRYSSKTNKVENKNAKIGMKGSRGSRIGKKVQKVTGSAKKPTGPFFSNELTLTFDYAAREQTCFYSAHLEVYWNGQKIKQIIPTDYDVHSMSFKLIAKPGKNILAFAGAGISDGRGATLTNVKLIRKSSFGLQDLVENGDFKQGNSNKWSSKIYKGSYPGWKGKQIQIGRGDFYNKNWNNDITVTELDANENTRIEQSFFFLDNYQVFYQVDPKDLSA